jgi:hypothetical protein
MKRPSRNTSSLSQAVLSKSIKQQLNGYALAAGAAGVAILALGQPGEAKIVYTPTHQKLPLNKDFFVDLNNDGTNDFRLHITLSGETCAAHRATCSSWDAAIFFAYPQVKGNGVVGEPAFASALRAGARIGPKAAFNTSRGIMGEVQFREQDLSYSGAWANSGKPVYDRYLGVKFLVDGKLHYGWARFSVRIYRDPKSTVNAVLTGYAYETIPNKPIIAGRKKGTDEVGRVEQLTPAEVRASAPQPASLGMLAMGSPALSIWRRKEVAAQ